jgi:CheY-like chemotaxis protein
MSRPLEKILLVEDEPDIRTVAQLSLQAIGGFQVELCSSGQEALTRAPIFKPDLILLDVMMPGMDGPTTYQELKRIPELAGVPVCFMTAKVQPQEVAQYKAMGALDVVPKPFDPMTLPGQIRVIWERRHG